MTITTFNDLIDDVFNEPIFRRSRKSYTNAYGNFDATVFFYARFECVTPIFFWAKFYVYVKC